MVKVSILPDETVDDLVSGSLKIIQKKDGYRFSLDPVLLCAFAKFKNKEIVVDLGTGGGVIPLILASRHPALRIYGVEIQPGMADRARRSIILNNLEDKVEIVRGDVRRITHYLAPDTCDAVLSNPPYRHLETGRLSLDSERIVARHEVEGGICDFLQAARILLKTGGRYYMVHLPERLSEIISEMRKMQLEPKRIRFIHSRKEEDARIVLIEGRKGGGGGLIVDPPLFIYEGEDYTSEYLRCYGDGG